MKAFTSIANAFKNATKRTKFLTLVAVTAVTVTGVAFAGFSPAGRPVFDWNNTADRKGSVNGPRINSFINTPYYGDERAFFDARMQENTTTSAYKDVLQNVNQGSHKVVMRTYIHNGANQDLNAAGTSIAKDAKVRIDLPTGASQALRARSYVSISNPAPGYPAEVTDTTELVDANGFSINYVPGSAKIFSSGAVNGKTLGDGIVGAGVPIGYDALNGTLPGCFDFQTFVEITVEVKPAVSTVQKTVRKAGDTNYGELATVAPGDKVQWLLRYDNKGQTPQTNVQLYDALPAHLQVVPSSVRWIYRGANAQDQDVVISNTDLFTKRVDFGSVASNSFFYVRFDTVALDDFSQCDISVRNEVRNMTKQLPAEIKDTADVHIVKHNCNQVCTPPNPQCTPVEECKPPNPKCTPEVVKPKFSCDLLTAKQGPNRKASYTTNVTAKDGATVKDYTYDFGDSTPKLTTDKAVVDHTYAKDGQYVTRVVVRFNVDNQVKTDDSDKCAAVVNFTTPPVTPPNTPGTPGKGTPSSLPNTGAGSTIAIFMAVTFASATAYYIVGRRNAGI